MPLYLFTFTVYLFTSLSQSSALLPDLEPPRWWTSGPPGSLHWPDQMRSPASRARQTQNQSCELLQTTSLTSYKHASLTNFQAFWPDLLVDVVEVLELFPRKFAVIHHIVAIHIQTFLHNSCNSKMSMKFIAKFMHNSFQRAIESLWLEQQYLHESSLSCDWMSPACTPPAGTHP